MRLSREDGVLLLGAIATEIEATHWKRLRRADYPNARTSRWQEVEAHLQADEDARNDQLRTVRDKIKAQI